MVFHHKKIHILLVWSWPFFFLYIIFHKSMGPVVPTLWILWWYDGACKGTVWSLVKIPVMEEKYKATITKLSLYKPRLRESVRGQRNDRLKGQRPSMSCFEGLGVQNSPQALCESLPPIKTDSGCLKLCWDAHGPLAAAQNLDGTRSFRDTSLDLHMGSAFCAASPWGIAQTSPEFPFPRNEWPFYSKADSPVLPKNL